MDGWSAKVSCQAIRLLELMTQRHWDRKPLYCPWCLSTDQAPSVTAAETSGNCSLPSVTQICPERFEDGWLWVSMSKQRLKKKFTRKYFFLGHAIRQTLGYQIIRYLFLSLFGVFLYKTRMHRPIKCSRLQTGNNLLKCIITLMIDNHLIITPYSFPNGPHKCIPVYPWWVWSLAWRWVNMACYC